VLSAVIDDALPLRAPNATRTTKPEVSLVVEDRRRFRAVELLFDAAALGGLDDGCEALLEELHPSRVAIALLPEPERRRAVVVVLVAGDAHPVAARLDATVR
jgi:hypothetical protein